MKRIVPILTVVAAIMLSWIARKFCRGPGAGHAYDE